MTDTKWSDLPLADNHRDKLISSAVSPHIAKLRGYYSENDPARIRALGFAERQALAPAMIIPLINPEGAVTGYQTKPDRPRLSPKGRAIKYETAAGSVGVVNCGPLTFDNCDNADCPLIVTEGAIKADALESHGYNSLSLAGVFNYSYRDDDGDALFLPDWDLIELKGRKMGIAFDYPDIYLNSNVQLAATRLQAFLTGRGASVVLLDMNKAMMADGEQ